MIMALALCACGEKEKLVELPKPKVSEGVRGDLGIDANVNEVAHIVDNNSATSEETAAVSQEQTAQVETKVQMMNKFKI